MLHENAQIFATVGSADATRRLTAILRILLKQKDVGVNGSRFKYLLPGEIDQKLRIGFLCEELPRSFSVSCAHPLV